MTYRSICVRPDHPGRQSCPEKRVDKFRTQNIVAYVDKLNCPLEQKLKLMDAVAESIRQSAKEAKSAEQQEAQEVPAKKKKRCQLER